LIAAGLHYTPAAVTLLAKQAEYGRQRDMQNALPAVVQVPVSSSPAPAPAPKAKAKAKAKPAGRPCTPKLAGFGSRSGAICYDMLDAQRRAPYMVVLPKQGDRQLAISKFEILVADFNQYCALSRQCSVSPAESQQPVTDLSFTQVEGYTRWLSDRTGVFLPAAQHGRVAICDQGDRS
jgi:hypothetical protein